MTKIITTTPDVGTRFFYNSIVAEGYSRPGIELRPREDGYREANIQDAIAQQLHDSDIGIEIHPDELEESGSKTDSEEQEDETTNEN